MRRSIVTLLLLSSTLVAADNVASVREQEQALAVALRTDNRAALSDLLAGDFHYAASVSCAAKVLQVDLDRQDWIARIAGLRTRFYEAQLRRIEMIHTRVPDGTIESGANHALASVSETWTMESEGAPVRRTFENRDLWRRSGKGRWLLVRRDVTTSGPDCEHLEQPD